MCCGELKLHGVSIPYSSGLSFRSRTLATVVKEILGVSIPYSSGLSFRCSKCFVRVRIWFGESQSLIHQISVSDIIVDEVSMVGNDVSIPYSSGLSFRWLKQKATVYSWIIKSQSLIHQVSVSDDKKD